MTAVITTDVLASKIVVKARRKPVSIAIRRDLAPHATSSLKRSKIKILASTATPMDKMMPAIPGKVSVALRANGCKQSRVIITNTNIAKVATKPAKRYKRRRKMTIKAKPTPKAMTDLSLESCPKDGPTVRTSITFNLTGRAPDRSKSAVSFASSKDFEPVIWA